MPYAVGVDIGCGMIAASVDIREDVLRDDFDGFERKILKNIEKKIPSHAHQSPRGSFEEFLAVHGWPRCISSLRDNFESTVASQFGTLGSGNHFVEISADDSGRVWFVLHSGSRGAGNQIGTHYVKLAKDRCRAERVKLESQDFAWLVEGDDTYVDYVSDMRWAQSYAFAQRQEMLDGLVSAVEEAVGRRFQLSNVVNCHHNYAEEIDDGVWLTRKGAIDASWGKLGVVPGSMGTDTYIVQGKGCAEAYFTSPHGAGRVMARGVAKRDLSLDDFKAQMELAGRTWLEDRPEAFLDEAPLAYKPIEVVIEDSRDLIDPVVRLSAFINYKGA